MYLAESNHNFFKIIEPISLSCDEDIKRKKIINNYAKENHFTIKEILVSDFCTTVAKVVTKKGKNFILKYYEDRDNFERELVGLFFLKNSKISKVHKISSKSKIIEIEFFNGFFIKKIDTIDNYLDCLAHLHVEGIENISNTIKLNNNLHSTYSNYYEFCFSNAISVKGEFAIGDHNPGNYLVNNNKEIIRIDLGSFQLQQPIVFDIYLLLHHIGDIYEYNEDSDNILFNYYESFNYYSIQKSQIIRKHIGSHFNVFKQQVDILAKYIDESFKSFNQFYIFLREKLRDRV